MWSKEKEQLRVLRLLAALVAQDDRPSSLLGMTAGIDESEAVEVGADLGVGPAGVADDFAADVALAIDDVGLRPAVGAVELCDGLIGVADGVQIDVESIEEAAIGAGVFVDAYCEDGDIGAIVMKLDEGWSLLDARRALAPPEVQKDDFAAVIGETDGVFAVAYRKVGRLSVGICRYSATVAGCGQRQHEQGAEGDETRKPHVSIIRSDGDRKEGQLSDGGHAR